jgi:hypothetical protein
MNAYAPLPAVAVTRACDMKIGDWKPEDRFYCQLTGATGTLKFDSHGRPWLVTGKIGHMSKVKLDSLVLAA